MRLGSKAKLTIGIGLCAASGFAAMGLRELGRSSQSPSGQDVSPLSAQAAVQKPAPAQPLLVATTRTIRTGETIRADMIRNAAADPVKFPTAVSASEILGKVATQDIPANSLIPRGAIDRAATLAIRVPMGMRAISIDTTAEIAVAGLVQPGDRVDVQVVYPGEDAITGVRSNGSGRSEATTLLQMVPVLAVGDVVVGTPPASGIAAGTSAPPPPARTVTLALSPEQVSRLSLAKSTGTLYLSLRNPGDRTEVALAPLAPRPIAPATPPRVQATRPAPHAAYRPAPRRAAEPRAIELVVGGNSETIYSGSVAH